MVNELTRGISEQNFPIVYQRILRPKYDLSLHLTHPILLKPNTVNCRNYRSESGNYYFPICKTTPLNPSPLRKTILQMENRPKY